jgi:hypothetical protein
MMNNIFADAKQRNEAYEKGQESARKAAYGSLSTLRIVSKALAGSVTQDTLGNPEAIEDAAKALIAAIGEQTIALNDRLGGGDDRIILESITGSVASVISEHYRHSGRTAFSVDWASVLASSMEVDGIWREPKDTSSGGSLAYRRSLSMMHGLAPVLAAHQRFNFFQPDENAVIERMGNLMWETVDATVQQSSVIEKMEEPEKEMLRRNLLLRSGEMLASSWNANAGAVVQQVKESTTEERRFWKTNGFSLAAVERDFQASYRSLEQAFSVSLNAHFDSPDITSDTPTP